MALFHCKICSHRQEVPNDHIGRKAKCPKCQNISTIQDTLAYITTLTDKYLEVTEHLSMLERGLSDNFFRENSDSLPILDPSGEIDYDIHNTDMYAQEGQYTPITTWLKGRKISATINPDLMNTKGFFDEIAIMMGDSFQVLEPMIKQIKYIQSRGFDKVKIPLAKYSKAETQQIIDFAKTLHEYSFIQKFWHDKTKKSLYLTLQSDMPRIQGFFMGLWMEWYVMIKIFGLFQQKNISLPLARGMHITFGDKQKNELDIFFINERDEPVVIECKTGEFRQDISKYISLRKKIGLKKENFILCVFGLPDELIHGFNTMFDISFANEMTLIPYLETIL